MFPLKVKQYENKKKFIHLILLLTGIIILYATFLFSKVGFLITMSGVLLALLAPNWGCLPSQFVLLSTKFRHGVKN